MDEFQTISKQIFDKIKSVEKILMHCHVRPDPDSVGSVMGMKLALEKNGKKVTVISGDDFPLEAVNFLPRFNEIETKSFDEVDLSKFDLYLCLDTGGQVQITYKKELKFPLSVPTIVIDHHISNPKFGEINLVMPKVSSCAEMIFLLLKDWNINIDKDIATCLYTGIWADTGGFKYAAVTSETYRVATDLVKIGANFNEIIFKLTSIKTKNMLAFAKVFAGIKSYFQNKLLITKIPLSIFREFGISDREISNTKDLVAQFLSSCIEPELTVVIYEFDDSGRSSISMRSNNPKKIWDVSKLAEQMGGGGHKQAAGGKFQGNVDDAEKYFLKTLDNVYPEFKNVII
jgi:phosphoesterase RecJ-like protein